MDVIDIGSVLKKFDDTADELDFTVKNYGIRFITADGRLRTMRARKNVKSPNQKVEHPNERGKVMYNLKRAGNMMLHDLEADEPRHVKVATICFFADHNQTAWQRVFH